jgi:hypothetical protein
MPSSDHETPLADNVIVGRLPVAVLARWEAFLMTTAVGRRYYNERYNEIDAQAEARGEARGKAEALLLVLEIREITVPDQVRERVLACTDTVQLDEWVRRATTADSIADVIRD